MDFSTASQNAFKCPSDPSDVGPSVGGIGNILGRLQRLNARPIDLSLCRIERLLAVLGHPEQRLPPVIHVAGTNGKGSTIAFMRGILEASGLSVHVYTSPHLVCFSERIRLGQLGGGKLIEDALLIEALEHCEAANGGEPITFFEITTAAAFVLFAEHRADVALIEVGLGGRADATNVIADPLAAVVSSIGRDHAEYLGSSIRSIAREKAGIFKRGRAAVIGFQDYEEASAELSEQAAKIGAKPVIVGNSDFLISQEYECMYSYEDEGGVIPIPPLPLRGHHQLSNAATAIATLRAVDLGGSLAFGTGLKGTRWPGRLQRLTSGYLPQLLPSGAELWLDGAHNPDAGRALSLEMRKLGIQRFAPLVLIVGFLRTKEVQEFLLNFVGLASCLVAVPLPNEVEGRAPAEVVEISHSLGLSASARPGLEAAIAGVPHGSDQAPRILICGSLYLVGAALRLNGAVLC